MSWLSASELVEAGLALPASLRKDVTLRLLESVEVVDDSIQEAGTSEISSRVDDVVSGRVATVPHDEVLAHLAERRAARQAARTQA